MEIKHGDRANRLDFMTSYTIRHLLPTNCVAFLIKSLRGAILFGKLTVAQLVKKCSPVLTEYEDSLPYSQGPATET
jgi:hypothetical protein